MRPLRVEIQGLRSYRGRVDLDLRGTNLFAVIGDTGSGKSSILEAIVFALYNGTTWSANETKPLICGDGDGTASVMLEFAADGKIWRVSRRISRRASLTNKHRLECLTPGDVPFEPVDNVADIRGKIQEIVGLSYRAFITSVVLPQGQFENLLLAGDTDRSDILKGIFRLEDLAIVRDRARSHREEERGEENRLLEERTKYMPNPAEVLENARGRVAELKPTLERLTDWCKVAEAADAQLASIRSERAILATNERRLETARKDAQELSASLSALKETASSFRSEKEHLVSVRATAEEKLEHVRAELETILKDVEDPSDLSRMLHEARSLPDKMRGFRELRDGLSRRETEVAQLETSLFSASSEQEAKQRKARTRREARDDLRRKWDLMLAAVTGLDHGCRDLRRISEELDENEARFIGSRTALDEAQKTAVNLETRHAEMNALFLEHVRADAGLKVSIHSRVGEPCPVCDRELPEGFAGPSPNEVEAEETRLREANEDLKHVAEKLNDARGNVQVAKDRISSLNAELEEILGEEKTVRQKLARLAAELFNLGAITETAASVPSQIDTDELLRTEAENLRSAEDAFGAATTAEASADQTYRDLAAKVNHSKERTIEDAGQLERDRKSLLEALRSLPTFAAVIPREALPVDLSVSGISDEAVAKAESDIETKLEEMRTAHGKERALLDEIAGVKDKLQQHYEREEHEVLAPAREATLTLRGIHQELETVSTDQRSNGERDGRLNHRVVAPRSDASMRELHDYADRLTEAARRLLEHENRVRSVLESSEEEQEVRLRRTLGAAGAATYQELLDKRQDTDVVLRMARDEAERAERALPAVERIEAGLEESRRKRKTYDTLHTLLAPGKFVRYAATNRQQQLLGVASDILKQMTDGEYGFTDNFAVIHLPSRQQRPARTLSGGETFLASLSLALGLMEIAGRSGGRLDAFFLDEGFGTLDPKTLDRALAELERRAQGGRMVALLSHVPEVADYVRGHGRILRVRRDRNGASIVHFDDEEPEVHVDATKL